MAAPGMLSTTLPPPPLLTKHLNSTACAYLSQVSHAPLEFPKCVSMTAEEAKQAVAVWRQTCSVTKVREAASSSQTPRAPFIRPLSILSPQAVCSGGTKKDMGVKSAIELYNPVVCFQLFPSDDFQAQSIEGSSPSAPTCPFHSV